MKHLLKGLLYSSPWWASCMVYTYFHMAARTTWYFSDLTIWLYCFCCGVAFCYLVGESAHEEDRRAWEVMHREMNSRLIDQSVALAPPTHNTNGHKREVSA